MLQIQRDGGAARAPAPDFDDPLGLLVHCHGKLEAQLAALERAAGVLRDGAGDALPSVREAIEAARAHFAGPGVKHTADEEQSLFPRLRARCGERERDVLAALEELETQHRALDRAHAGLDAAFAPIASAAVVSAVEVESFGTQVEALVGLYRPHIALENEVVFPAAARLLAPDEVAALGAEMRSRRKR